MVRRCLYGMGWRIVALHVKRPVTILFVVYDLTRFSTFATIADPGRIGAQNKDLRCRSVGYIVQEKPYFDDQKSARTPKPLCPNIIRNVKMSTT